ncbi:hypothetical protein BC835DRAFT_1256150, partial [Cytidiella melzeri]
REVALAEMLRLEGWRGTSKEGCPLCPHGKRRLPRVRCDDCWNSAVLCESCCVEKHGDNPLHRVKQWNGSYFEPTTLQALGLVIQVGHPPYERCAHPQPALRSFLVMHTNGLHPVTLLFCQCQQAHQAGTRYQQLLRAELFPSTVQDPTICCTFRMMEQFHMLTLQSKITAYDYYTTLSKLTDNVGLAKSYDCFKPFLRLIRQWRHLKMLKRAGRGHYANGSKTTQPGELCVTCPACPNPDVNLPDNWQSASDDLKYAYTTVIALDANFRLRRRAVSNESRDPALSSGWGYFVADKPYREYPKDRVDNDEVNYPPHEYLVTVAANNKFTKGYSTSGVVLAIDARHGFVLPHGIGDLQKGERYSNVDYVVASAWKLLPPTLQRVISYDIACQWATHFLSRVDALPPHLQFEIPENGDLRYAIPKFHFRAHKHDGHDQFSLNLMPGVGQVDGEEIERNWSRHNQVAYSTREMGPGSRHDTLEDHFGFANWQKFVDIAFAIRRKLKDAGVEKVVHDKIYIDFCEQLQHENVALWTQQVIEWEKDTKLPSPYHIPSSGVTEAEVKAQLLEDDGEVGAEACPSGKHVTAVAMMISLFDMEQQKTSYPRLNSAQPLRTAVVVEKRRALQLSLDKLRLQQAAYMPIVPQLLARRTRGAGVDELPEEESLFFPSDLTVDELRSCTPGIADIEERLRDGQLHDALDKLRLHLHIKTRLITFKDRNVRNQVANTRARSKINANEVKVRVFAAKYRRARNAKLRLSGPGEWEKTWRPLMDNDIRTLRGDLTEMSLRLSGMTAGESEGRKRTSWIWMSADHLHLLLLALRVEFLKARARCHCFAEEIRSLQHDQRRMLIGLEKAALVWESRVHSEHKQDFIVRDGLASYAAEQADLRRRLVQ